MLVDTLISIHEVTIDIGEMPILVRTDSMDFRRLVEDRYGAFVSPNMGKPAFELDIELVEPEYGTRDTRYGARDSGLGGDEEAGFGIRYSDLELRSSASGLRLPDLRLRTSDPGLDTPDSADYDRDLSVRLESGRWVLERGDFRAELDPGRRRGWVRQTANPYSLDGVLRILHSLLLAREGGFLVHAAGAVRHDRAYLFAGVSGAGKTTISRLAPPDVKLLTDEISYVRPGEQVSGARCQVSGCGSREGDDGTQESEVRGPKSEGKKQEAGGRSRKAAVRSPRSEARSQQAEVRSQEAGLGIWDLRTGPIRKSPIANLQSPITNRPSIIENLPNPEARVPKPESLSPAVEESLTPNARHLAPAFEAFGTPFAGELARIGEKVHAPLAAVFLLEQGRENRIEPVSESQATRELLRHVLFFAEDAELVGMIFATICDFVRRVPVRRLVFAPDPRVWELIGIVD